MAADIKRVLVAMSGGVDSSVAAALMRDAGHEVVGVTMKLWGGESDTGCCSVSDVDDARRVAATLRERGVQHFSIVDPDAGWVLRLLAGAALAGVQACQHQADIAPGELADQAAMLGHHVVVSRRSDLRGDFDVVDPGSLQKVRDHKKMVKAQAKAAKA